MISVMVNPDYGALANPSVGRREWWSLFLENGVQGMGRLMWQLVFPIQQSVYFEPDDIRNLLGAAVGAGLIFCLSVVYFRKFKDRSTWCWIVGGDAGLFGFLSLILFLPEALFLLRRDDFAVADRFIFLPLPYALFSLVLGWYALTPKKESERSGGRRFSWGEGGVAGVLVLYAIISARVTPVWNDAVALARHCIEGVNAPRCWELLVQELRTQGCSTLKDDEKALRNELEKQLHKRPSPFLVEGFASLAECYAKRYASGVDERQQMIAGLAAQGAPPEALANALGLLLLERGELDKVASLINDVFLVNGPGRTSYFTPTRLGDGLGQLQVACLAEEQLRVPVVLPCRPLVLTFQRLFGGNLLRESEVVEARGEALTSLRRGGIVVKAPS